MEKKYTQSVTSTGGGREGRVKGDGGIDMALTAKGTNPEALLAAAWAGCYNGALQAMMQKRGLSVDKHQPEVTASVDFYNQDDGGFKLGANIVVKFEAQDEIEDVQGLLDEAHAFCPVSKLYRGEYVELAVAPA